MRWLEKVLRPKRVSAMKEGSIQVFTLTRCLFDVTPMVVIFRIQQNS